MTLLRSDPVGTLILSSVLMLSKMVFVWFVVMRQPGALGMISRQDGLVSSNLIGEFGLKRPSLVRKKLSGETWNTPVNENSVGSLLSSSSDLLTRCSAFSDPETKSAC